MSLRRRLLLGLLAVSAVLVVTNVTLAHRFRSVLLDRVDRQLAAAASRDVFRPPGGGRQPGLPERPPVARDQTFSEYFIAVGDLSTGTVIQLSSALADDGQARPRLGRGDIAASAVRRPATPLPFSVPAESGSGTWRVVAVADARDRVTVVALSLGELESTLERLRLVQVLGTLSVLATLALVSWWMLRLGVHPIEDMARTADAIAQGDLSRRVEHPGGNTEVGRLGQALNTMLERIQESFRAREKSEAKVRRFAADASHELRTPLTSILGYAELWRAGGLKDPPALADAMRRMEQEARRMTALTEDLLLLARLDQDRAPARVPVRLDELVADAVSDARAVEPDRPLESALEPVVIEGDEAQLRQVVANLLTNVRVHTPAATPVRVAVTAIDGTARLTVADEGPGMTPEVASSVFERFFRADASRARAGGGTGLGLAIVEAIVNGHGGFARVESALGAGSSFIVELPASGQHGGQRGSAR
ncbi:MAG TPA: HAMP domain-containing sensor histidine kinase [Acidimicrobiales bacterium]|nr:HAMP domain-containing sensor histidine kinase [Acidimicrobiales bacterium]